MAGCGPARGSLVEAAAVSLPLSSWTSLPKVVVNCRLRDGAGEVQALLPDRPRRPTVGTRTSRIILLPPTLAFEHASHANAEHSLSSSVLAPLILPGDLSAHEAKPAGTRASLSSSSPKSPRQRSCPGHRQGRPRLTVPMSEHLSTPSVLLYLCP